MDSRRSTWSLMNLTIWIGIGFYMYYFVELFLLMISVAGQSTVEPPTPDAGNGITPIFQFGDPEIFVFTDTGGNDRHRAYQFINRFKGTQLLDEYVIFARGNENFKGYLLLYDTDGNDVIEQNLGKEMYWEFVNSTGTFPSITIINTTFQATMFFQTEPNNTVSYLTSYAKSFISTETIPPYDLIFEIPANTRSLRKEKTLVDFQSWGLLRWQLSDKDFVTWAEIKKEVESLRPTIMLNATNHTVANWEVNAGNFIRIDNPCLPDIFIMYLVVGDKASGVHQVYADIPAFHLTEDIPNFYNLTGSFCPHHRSRSFEECGYVQQIILTNDYLIGLTDKGLYVSAALNSSDKDVSARFDEKPLLSYQLIDPCAKFSSQISCFKQGITSLSSELIHSVRLFYLPVCNLFQFPSFEDRVIFVIEHTTTVNETDKGDKKRNANPPSRSITVLHAKAPYIDWKALFIGMTDYNKLKIISLIGIFFNHQLRHFDITIKVQLKEEKLFEYRRFVLPDLKEEDNTQSIGYSSITNLMGNGFLEKKFPGTFQLEEIFVHTGPMDVFFVGSQLWIAESGHALVYQSIGGLADGSLIRRCSFNHPDRMFVCVNSLNTILIVGRVGSSYSAIVVKITGIDELWTAASPQGSYWTKEYAESVMKSAYFTAAFSGKLIMWFLYDEELLKKSQMKLLDSFADKTECDALEPSALVSSCHALFDIYRGAEPKSPNFAQKGKRGAYFRMIAITPTNLKHAEEPTAGPLVPFFVDSITGILYEAKLPGDEAQHIYFSSVFIGQEVSCLHFKIKPNWKNPTPDENCQMFVRHVKPVAQYLDGFRQILYTTISKAIPMIPVNSNVSVLFPEDGGDKHNLAFVRLHTGLYNNSMHIGQTHYFPGFYSILIQGFPDEKDLQIMWGFATKQVNHEVYNFFKNRTTYIIDLSTPEYRESRIAVNAQEYQDYQKRQSARADAKSETEKNRNETNNKNKEQYEEAAKFVGPDDVAKFKALLWNKPSTPKITYDAMAVIKNKSDTIDPPKNPPALLSPIEMFSKPHPNEPSWVVADGSCHLTLQLLKNNVLLSHGGRISLDLHDALSLKAILRPNTELGRILMYRPLFVLTNSNPDVLLVEKVFERDNLQGTQTVYIFLAPTGAKMGVASFVIRSVISSTKCINPTSITLIVQVHREQGRRLHVNYPIPICMLPARLGGYTRPWKEDHPNCIPYEEVLKAGSDNDTLEEKSFLKRGSSNIFIQLQKNYRPPSTLGEQIPLSAYTYNADPDPKYKFHNNWYHISNDTRRLRKCNFRKTREDCRCSMADTLSDHPDYTDCKQMAFTVMRSKSFIMSVEYDPVMKKEDQHPNFYTDKDHLSVYIEEINNRTEYTIDNAKGNNTAVLKAINQDPVLNEGKTFYNARAIEITLHGTGLFHFKAGLGKFDSFEEVTGYFVIYSDSNELNHVKLIVVMLLTITFCFSLVFFGFVRVRRRLSSQLPFQTRAKSKFKLE